MALLVLSKTMVIEDKDNSETNNLIREKLKQVSSLQEKVDAMQKKLTLTSDDEMEV